VDKKLDATKKIDLLNPVEQLDFILHQFCYNAFWQGNLTDGEIDVRLNKDQYSFVTGTISISDLLRVLNKLVKDGYLFSELNDKGTAKYSLTWDGKYHYINEGGYLQKQADKATARLALETQNKTTLLHSQMASYGSVGAAIIAGLLLTLELVKFYQSLLSNHCH
jgi:hypothetical protein